MKRRRRVAHVSLGLDVGGQERLLVEFARHADRERFDLLFVSLTGRGKLAQTIEDLGWPVHALEERQGFRPQIILPLIRLFRGQGCDVIHTHDDRPLLYGALAVKLAWVRRHIHTQHHGLLPQITQRQRRLAGWAGRLTDVFVCVSKDSARYMADTGFPPDRITTIWNGIDLDKYPYRGPNPEGPALTMARLSAEKDIANLLRATAIASQSAPDFRLDIAGDGHLRAELQQLAAELQLQDRVRFLGEQSDIPSLLGRARLFVLPSRTEGISLTILEAMASGLPVVATDVGGNPEVMERGGTGLLVPAANPAELASALLQIWRHPDNSRNMGLAGRHRVEAYFDVRAMVAKYEQLYLGNPRPCMQ